MCTHWSSHQQVVVILVWTVVFMNTQALRLVRLNNPLQKTNNLSTTTLLVEVQVIFYMLQYVYNSMDLQVAKLIKAGQSHKF